MALVRGNVDRLREEVSRQSELKMDVMLVHYDSNHSRWQESANDTAWYARNVQFSAEMPGYKMKLAELNLYRNNTEGVNVSSYEWLWFLDEDADLSNVTLKELVAEARHSGSSIIGPAVLSPEVALAESRANSREELGCQPGTPQCLFAAPNRTCRYRHTNFVEVMFPLLTPGAFWAVMEGCADCLHEHTVWGLDKIWCSLVARMTNRSTDRVCAILDEVQVIHANYKTLKKWIGLAIQANDSTDVLSVNRVGENQTRMQHREDYQTAPAVLRCEAKR
uniref:Glycosyltransferase 2-like domain-containing protein n=2 Tax=Pyrodinium bahamense TaxID=73915 RepID=A0A7S0F9E4_9DINO